MKKKIYLPIFDGFYESHLSPDETYEMEHIEEQRGRPIKYEECEWDYKTYMNEVGENACTYIENCFEQMGLTIEIVFNGIWSPKYYNYTTDKVECTAIFNSWSLRRKFLEIEDYEDFFEQFKSRSGFISFYPELQNIIAWKELKKPDNVHIERMMQAILLYHPKSDFNMDEYREACLQGVALICSNYEQLVAA